MTRYYVSEEHLKDKLDELNKKQTAKNTFVNITVEEYHGMNFPGKKMYVIKVG